MKIMHSEVKLLPGMTRNSVDLRSSPGPLSTYFVHLSHREGDHKRPLLLVVCTVIVIINIMNIMIIIIGQSMCFVECPVCPKKDCIMS